ncbi:MAG: L-histidine N(alpha)-methyltransferase [Gammaproteobacteria bacterium]|nr:MAG: L-histidine N(alpha)-methyltransferase [Gammaproteobacteria bacterium]
MSDVIHGLSSRPRTIPPKYFYDQRGSELFDAICDQPEYYLTRTELGILQDNAAEIARLIGPECMLIELGSGASEKVRHLFDALQPASYIAVDISKDFLLASTQNLAQEHPWLEVHAICADFSSRLDLPPQCNHDNMVAFYPGSSIGNFSPKDAVGFMRELATVVDSGGKLLIGVDLKKDSEILHTAYNDAAGLTADFNLNLLKRMKDELGAELNEEKFAHEAFYNESEGRIEMHIVSTCNQSIKFGEKKFLMTLGESIHTENSYKYTIEEFSEIAASAGFRVIRIWTDKDNLFSVQLLEAI